MGQLLTPARQPNFQPRLRITTGSRAMSTVMPLLKVRVGLEVMLSPRKVTLRPHKRPLRRRSKLVLLWEPPPRRWERLLAKACRHDLVDVVDHTQKTLSPSCET